MPVPAHRHQETFSHLIGSYGYILDGRVANPLYIDVRLVAHGQVPPTRCESVDRNGTRSRREGKGTFPMITSQATHRKENLTNLAIFLVAENGEIGKEISSFDKKQCDWRV